jgi:hypothetical protein
MRPWFTRFFAVLASCALPVSLVVPSSSAATYTPRAPAPNGTDRVESIKKAAVLDAVRQGAEVLFLKEVRQNERVVGWAVTTGLTNRPSSAAAPFAQIKGITLHYYVDGAGLPASLSSNGPLDDPRFGHDPAASAGLECVDLNGDGIDEVIVTQTRPGASWAPSCAFVFRLGPEKLVPVATITSHYPIPLTELDEQSRPVLPSTYAIGKSLAHAAQPRWTDYYRFDGRQMLLANRFCPQQFRSWPKQLKDLLRNQETDGELWYFLGRACQALGKDQESSAAIERARSLRYSAPNWKTLQAGIHVPTQNALGTMKIPESLRKRSVAPNGLWPKPNPGS